MGELWRRVRFYLHRIRVLDRTSPTTAEAERSLGRGLEVATERGLAIDEATDAALAELDAQGETPLLVAAEARGLRGVDGLGMLLHQAVPAFSRWFGVSPRVTPALRDLIVADIEGR